MITPHTFHIPVMGIGFTIDTPLKVSKFGIDSVISIGDDILLEKLRKVYSDKYKLPYEEITVKEEDFRAKRITAYLNLINKLSIDQFNRFKKIAIEKEGEIKKYIDLLPSNSVLRIEFNHLMEKSPSSVEIRNWINEKLTMGNIDVNIMTKVNRDLYVKSEKLPVNFSDANSGLRGYAKSDLASSVIFSAGLNPKLYSYIEEFEDFFPNEKREIKKKIIIKVSDYRSALIQGKFLAKKGIWVSEYRIESGLNCGGHAFATDGDLFGAILEEFKAKRKELIHEIHEIYASALFKAKGIQLSEALPLKISAQGGVGTHEEHQFLIDHYQIDSVGWGSPFLLVPEATIVDKDTLNQLVEAKEKDLYLSDVSPLGIRFNNLRNTTKELEKRALIAKGKPGSPCVKKYLSFDKEFTEKGLCTASRKYQVLKIKQLDEEKVNPEIYQERFEKIVEKECICTGLGTSALINNSLDTKVEGHGVSVCPGPNIAYFSKVSTLKEMIDHIYGRENVITRTDRPNMFIKELEMYVDYLKGKLRTSPAAPTIKQKQYLETFAENLNAGIEYYSNLFSNLADRFKDVKTEILRDLGRNSLAVNLLNLEIKNLAIA